jgi:hypothetical protein
MVLEGDLRRIIHDKPASVVWVIGTGVPQGALQGTASAPYSSWAGLLGSGLKRICDLGMITADELADHERLLRHDKLNSWLLVAQAVEQGLRAPGGGEFRRWLRNTVGEFEKHIADRTVLDALAIHQHRGGLLATTNYDLLLENVTGLREVTWRTPADVERALRGDEPQILHLHGAWRSPDSVVLGIRSYDEVVGDPHARAVLTTLRTGYTFVFVGCGAGLHDPNLGSFLSWSATVFGGSEYRHFRLCRDSELAALRHEHPAEQRIFPLSYGNDHTDLAPFLRSLLPAQALPGPFTGPARTSTSTAPASTPGPATTPVPSVPTAPAHGPFLGNDMLIAVTAGLARLDYPENLKARVLAILPHLTPPDIDLLVRYVTEGIGYWKITPQGDEEVFTRIVVQEDYMLRFMLGDAELSEPLDSAAYNTLKRHGLITDFILREPGPARKPTELPGGPPPSKHAPFRLQWKFGIHSKMIAEAYTGCSLRQLLESKVGPPASLPPVVQGPLRPAIQSATEPRITRANPQPQSATCETNRPKTILSRRVMYAVAKELGEAVYSHAKINALFAGSGAPGEAPDGNLQTKIVTWFKRCNDASDVDVYKLLGGVLEELFERPEHAERAEKIRSVLAEENLCYKDGPG